MIDLISVLQKAARSCQDLHTRVVYSAMREKCTESMVVLGGS